MSVGTRAEAGAADRGAYELLLQAPVALVVFAGRDNIIEFVNDLFLPIAGLSREELLYQPAFKVMPMAASQGFAELLERIRATGEPLQLKEHETIIDRNGRQELFWLNISYQPIREPDGQVDRVMIMVTDVSEQVLSRRRLESGERQMSSLANAMPQLVWISEPSGRVTYYNERVSDFTGAVRLPDGSWSWEGLLHPDDIGPTSKAWAEAVASGNMYQMEHRVQVKDGTYRWLLSRGVPMRDDEGKIIRWYGTATDIHQVKMAEEMQAATAQRIKVSERRFRGTFENAAVGIAHVALDGHWLLVNDKLCSIVGYSRSELLQIGFQDITYPEDLEGDLELAGQLLRGEITTYTLEKRYIRKSGEIIWISLTASIERDEQGRPEFFISVVQDITEQKRLQEEQKQFAERLEMLVQQRTRELQVSNEDLQQFAHVASHDLKEPVRKIRTFAGRLQLDAESRLSEQGKVFLGKIESAAERMYNMIDGVLSYSTLTSTRQANEPVSLEEVIAQVESDLEVVLQQKQGVIRHSALPTIHGAAVLIHQLFYNLVNNSLKFSRPDLPPVIEVEANPASSGFVEIRVRDNGIGFEPELAGKIFETFTRLHSRDRYEGTGLGLALCKKIVERHGGTIRAEAEVGKGAVFFIILPES